MQRIFCFVDLVVQGYLMKWERLTWEVAEGLSVAPLRDREEGMVVAVKILGGEGRAMMLDIVWLCGCWQHGLMSSGQKWFV